MKTYSVEGVNTHGDKVVASGIRAKSVNHALDISGMVFTCNDLFVAHNDKVSGPFFPSQQE